jgi:hypothetical protein
MTEQSQEPAVSKMPNTWQEALEMWDAGEPVPAFQVESEGATQDQLWGLAFQVLRDPSVAVDGISHREADVVESIVHVAKLRSWPQLISSHVHAMSPALMVRKTKLGK